MKLGIIGAMDSEVAVLLAALDQYETRTAAGTVFYSGTLAGRPAVVAKCGIGKVCAALCTQALVDLYGVEGIVNTGVAGGLAPGMAVGDLVVATSAVQHDFDLNDFGYAKGCIPAAGGDKTVPTFWPTDPELSSAFVAAAERIKASNGETFTCRRGVIASGDVFVADPKLKETLHREFNAAAAEMEGAAMAQAAALNRIPCAIIRAISDLADGDAGVDSHTFELETATRSASIVIEMVKAL